VTLRVLWTPRADRDADRLGREPYRRILAALRRYAETQIGDVVKLRGPDPPEWRLRVGDYRVRFRRCGGAIEVLHVPHRREAYEHEDLLKESSLWRERARGQIYVADVLARQLEDLRTRLPAATDRVTEDIALVSSVAYHYGIALELAAKGAIATSRKAAPPPSHRLVQLCKMAGVKSPIPVLQCLPLGGALAARGRSLAPGWAARPGIKVWGQARACPQTTIPRRIGTSLPMVVETCLEETICK
jgi:mRNA-degrading endonuclease RelE of RelBE toxin-antitoxin system